jgi:hypothetical protein
LRLLESLIPCNEKTECRVARSGNGIDLGSVYQLLTEVAGTVRSHSDSLARINGRLDGVENRLADLGASVIDLRAAVRDYHTTVTGHGMLYGELEQRIRRIERHLKLEPSG